MAGGKLCLVLEGGYRTGAIKECALQCAKGILGYPLDKPR